MAGADRSSSARGFSTLSLSARAVSQRRHREAASAGQAGADRTSQTRSKRSQTWLARASAVQRAASKRRTGRRRRHPFRRSHSVPLMPAGCKTPTLPQPREARHAAAAPRRRPPTEKATARAHARTRTTTPVRRSPNQGC